MARRSPAFPCIRAARTGPVSWGVTSSHLPNTRYHGIFTPLVTPITPDETPDVGSLRRLVDFQLERRVHGLWVMGTSAEFASFTADERARACETVVDAARGRLPVVVNVSDASTRGAIRHARAAEAAGADAIAATPPYYYPHSQDELLDHYRRIRTALDLPLFIYNIPQTVKVRVELQTACTLAQEGTAVGVKDSQNDLEWFRQLTSFIARHGIEFSAFVGTRYLIDAGMVAGAAGAIPSIANAFPELAVDAYKAVLAGDYDRAARSSEHIMRIEALALAHTAGSRNAVILGLLKTVLHDRGVFSTPNLVGPLRSFTGAERADLLEKLADLSGVSRASPAG